MKTGKVLISFVDYKTGIAYQVGDEFTGYKKRFEELLKKEIISDSKVEIDDGLDDNNDEIDENESDDNNDEIDENESDNNNDEIDENESDNNNNES